MTSCSGTSRAIRAIQLLFLTFLLGSTAALAAPPSVSIDQPGNNSTFNEGATINFVGTASDPGEDGDVTASIAWSSSIDGALGNGGSINVSTLSVGTHTISADVTDSGAESGSDSITVTINELPEVTINTPSNGSSFALGASISFDADATDNEDNNNALTNQIGWSSSLDGNLGSGGSINVDDLTVGTHTITASVTDSDGGSGSASITVTITNDLPTVSITAPSDGLTTPIGTNVNFQGTASDGEDGNLASSIAWTSSIDGALGNGGSINVNDLSAGTHTITAAVTDSSSNAASDTISVTVTDNAPNVTINAPASGSSFPTGTTINFAASATDVEDDNTTLTGQISWTSSLDGNLGSGGAISVNDLSDGTHTITASVSDSDGNPASDTISVTITNNAPTVTITAPSSGSSFSTGTSVNFAATATDAEDDDTTLTGQVSWSSSLDGNLGSGGAISVNDLSDGTHTITASVSDSDGNPASDSISVTITNNAPTVTILAPADGSNFSTGTSINFAANATDAEDDNTTLTGQISWSSNVDGNLGTGGAISVNDLSDGTHTITASVTDSDGNPDSDSISVTITNNAPTVTITSPANGASFSTGTSINFAATATDAEDNNSTLTGQIAWSSNVDGNLGTGGSINVNSLSDGNHTITASVTDSDGNPGSNSITITITNNAPTVTITAPANGSNFATGASINFAATATDAEDDNTTLTGQIAWSSNVDGNLGSGGAISVNNLSDGAHTITAAVTDSDGNSSSDSINVTITNNAPTVNIVAPGNGTSFNAGTLVSFAATASDVEDDNTTLTGQISWSSSLDGAMGTGGSIGVNDLSVGTHTITASVTDSDGNPSSDSISVTITNNAPTVTINSPANGTSTPFGTNINFQASATDAEDNNATLTASISWTSNLDGALGTGGSINVADLSVGVHVISASATDSDGGTGSDSIGVTITNNAPVLSPIGAQSVVEGSPISISLSASDSDGQTLSFSSTALPAFCSPLVDNGNGTGAINCSPAVGDAGNYPITVTVSDTVPQTDSETFTLTVEGNQPPTATGVTISGTLALGEVLTGNYTYSDAEGDEEGASTFRWLRDNVAIAGATSTSYTVVEDDIEAALVFEVTPVALTGATTGTAVRSPEVSVDNVAPSIDAQATLETLEDTAITVTLADLTVTDSDNDYPDDFTMAASAGADYTVVPAADNKSLTITPALDFNGPLTVPVTVNDGFANSPPFDLLITVTPVNDAPVITGLVAPLSTGEDEPITIAVTDLTITDPDNVYPTDFTLTLQAGDNYTLNGNEVIPDADYNGPLSVPSTVNDGELDSAVFNIPISVAAVNDLPVLVTPIEDQQAVEDQPFTFNISGNFSDPEGDALTYQVAWLPIKPPSISFNGQTGVFSGTPRTADANDPGPVYTATVTARDPSGDFVTDEFVLTISLRDRANLALEIEVAPETGFPGDDLRFTLTASNPVGPQPGANVELTGSFVGAGLTVAAEGAANCVIQPPANGATDYVCQLGNLPVGGISATVFTVTTNEVSEVYAFATAAGAQVDPIDPNLDDNSDFLAAAVADSFSVGAVQILGNGSILSMAAGDINGDLVNDIVAGTVAGQNILVYPNDLPRESCDCQRDFLRSAIAIPDTGAQEGVALADFDRNGTLDIVVVNGGGQTDRVYSNDGAGNFTQMAALGDSFGHDVAVGDFNNDGNPDIAIAAVGGNPIWHGDGAGGFTLHATLGNANSLGVAVAKFDDNARDDVVFANVGSASRVWTKNANNGFTSASQLTIGDAVSVAAGLLDEDARPDLVFARVPNGVGDVPANPVILNNGNGTFPNTPLQLIGISPTNDVLIDDINGNGLNDLVFINASGVHQVWNSIGGSYILYREHIIDIGAAAGVTAHLGDIANGITGGVDLAMGGALGGGVAVYLNDGQANLGRGDTEPPVITLSGSPNVRIEAGQVYNDSGARAEDNIDGDITGQIVVVNSVNTAVVGTYTVTYNVTDFAGNEAATVTRTVAVDPAANSGGGGGGALSLWTLLVLFGGFLVAANGKRRERI